YAHINILSMLQRFEPDDVMRVATDSLYIRKTALHRIDGVKSYVAPRICDRGAILDAFLLPVAPAQWRDKGEKLYMPQEHAAFLAEPVLCVAKQQQKGTSCLAPRRATTTRCRGTR
ncbi:MAG: hypothetical protein AB2556_24900, partial [Candidatus Thiodiazotropha sp.]